MPRTRKRRRKYPQMNKARLLEVIRHGTFDIIWRVTMKDLTTGVVIHLRRSAGG